jgi:hypothetical protein
MFVVPSLELMAGSRTVVTAASVDVAKQREKAVKTRESDHHSRFRYDMRRGRRFVRALPQWEWT